jgi:hypothetical protein
MELLSQLLYSENIFSTAIGSHLENNCHFEENKWLMGLFKKLFSRWLPIAVEKMFSEYKS